MAQPRCEAILVVGANPAFQTTLQFARFRPDKVNRAYRKSHSIGGKGQNFAMAAHQAGHAHRISILQIVGGLTGSYIQQELDARGIHQISVTHDKLTRTCTTILDDFTGEMTELIEPAARIPYAMREEFESTAVALVRSRQPRAVALLGSLPSGMTGSTYMLIAEQKAHHPSLVVYLDACADVPCVLKTQCVDILKVNVEEAAAIVADIRISESNTDNSIIDPYDIKSLARFILKTYSIKVLAITNGPGTAFLFQTPASGSSRGVRIAEYSIPPLTDFFADYKEQITSGDEDDDNTEGDSLYGTSAPLCRSLPCPTTSPEVLKFGRTPRAERKLQLNPLGAGDTCSAVFLTQFLDAGDACDAFRHGLAAASASCFETESTGLFSRVVMDKILERISVRSYEEDVTGRTQ